MKRRLIDFVPGENAETLIEKYNAQLAKLDTTKGVLFLVDTWGGSPFNAQQPLSSTKSIMKSLQALTFQCSWKR